MTNPEHAAALADIERAFGAHLPLAGARLAGKTALISGAGCAGEVLGTGAAMAILFAAQGCDITVFDIDRTRAAATAALIERFGGRAQLVIGDVRSDADCAAAVTASVDRFGALDFLINNTAVARPGGIAVVTDVDWNDTIDINLSGVMRLSRAAVEPLAAAKGAIVNIASIAGQLGFGVIAYAASKGGVIAMTRDMAVTLGARDVRVNCIAPGHIATPMGGAHDLEKRAMRRKATALETEGSAWDVAWAALFLCGPEARWITAAILNVDAGSTARTTVNALQGLP